MYLLDTNVVSECRRIKPHGGVLAWLHTVADADLHICAVTIGEIQADIEITREWDAAKPDESRLGSTKLPRPTMCCRWTPAPSAAERA